MILDCHIHLFGKEDNKEEFLKRVGQCDIDGGVLISIPPRDFGGLEPGMPGAKKRVEHLMQWAEVGENFYPFFWIDPTEPDALEQVEFAISKGVKGFKVICFDFYPGDERAMPVYTAIAKHNKPILFHSGILWDIGPSAMYNHPGGWENLMGIEGLRFALAHISWPWCDECLAVYGKLENATRRGAFKGEMFIDISPGTPPIYRRDALTKIFTIGYNVTDNVLFGVDTVAGNYDVGRALGILERDSKIYSDICLSEETLAKIYSLNLRRFIEGH